MDYIFIFCFLNRKEKTKIEQVTHLTSPLPSVPLPRYLPKHDRVEFGTRETKMAPPKAPFNFNRIRKDSARMRLVLSGLWFSNFWIIYLW